MHESSNEDRRKNRHHTERKPEPKFLANDRKNKIRVSFRQKIELLSPLPQPSAPGATSRVSR